jgi:hypothetical protein
MSRIVAIMKIPNDAVEMKTLYDRYVYDFGYSYPSDIYIFSKAYYNTLWWKLPSFENVSTSKTFLLNTGWSKKAEIVKRQDLKVGNFTLSPVKAEEEEESFLLIKADGDVVPGTPQHALLERIISGIRSTIPEPTGMMPAPKANFKGLPAALMNRIAEFATPAAEAKIPGLKGGRRRRKTARRRRN